MILADEGLNGQIVAALRSEGFNVEWIAENNPGIDDQEVIGLAKQSGRLLITEDKDFGEWVFVNKVRGVSVVLLRYNKLNLDKVLQFLRDLLILKKDKISNDHTFITIDKNGVRRRNIN